MSKLKKYVFVFHDLNKKELCHSVLLSKSKEICLKEVPSLVYGGWHEVPEGYKQPGGGMNNVSVSSTPSDLASVGLVPLFYGDS